MVNTELRGGEGQSRPVLGLWGDSLFERKHTPEQQIAWEDYSTLSDFRTFAIKMGIRDLSPYFTATQTIRESQSIVTARRVETFSHSDTHARLVEGIVKSFGNGNEVSIEDIKHPYIKIGTWRRREPLPPIEERINFFPAQAEEQHDITEGRSTIWIFGAPTGSLRIFEDKVTETENPWQSLAVLPEKVRDLLLMTQYAASIPVYLTKQYGSVDAFASLLDAGKDHVIPFRQIKDEGPLTSNALSPLYGFSVGLMNYSGRPEDLLTRDELAASLFSRVLAQENPQS